ncbi:MAG: polysaccharide deacetylase family protein [Candidatus Omnitrophica bacterium]|nr:polysaccharide deacetylase family protein [Candidatus Omnitrophota bacterium]
MTPITLMYHGIIQEDSDIPKEREVGADIYDVALAEFRKQIRWLHENAFRSVIFNGQSFDPKELMITFDDGEANNFNRALPVLNEYGYKAYFFVIAKRVDRDGYMDWDQLKKLHEAGHVIGSHGHTHEILTNLKPTQIEQELKASKKFFERNLGIPVETMSIPRGFCNDQILKMAYDTGYQQVFISDPMGRIHQPYISRVAVKKSWQLERFHMAMEGKMPFKERFSNTVIKSAKFVLRESGYNFFRKMILSVMK